MGTPDLWVLKIASAQPVCLMICGKEIRLKRNVKGKSELRKIGNGVCAILIISEKTTSLPDLGHVYSLITHVFIHVHKTSVPQTV